MTEKDNDSNSNIDDKDYGFPFVEVTPILSSEISKKKETIDATEEKNDALEIANPIIPQIPKSPESTIKIKSEKKAPRKTKSQLPLLLSLVFLIVIILGSIAYFLYYLPESDANLETNIPTVSEELMAEKSEVDETENLETEMEEFDNAAETESEAPVDASVPDVIAAEIIIVDRRGEIPLYNLIVASSPNERIARTEAQKIIDKGRNAWIIFPFGNTNNYRISVGRYEDLESATKALETAKVELNESSWILKY